MKFYINRFPFSQTFITSQNSKIIFFFFFFNLVILSAGMAQQKSKTSPLTNTDTLSNKDGVHDFDSHVGTWKTHLRRLKQPLSGTNDWIEYEGTTIVKQICNGKANLVELDVSSPGSHIEGLSLRLYNPQSKQWSLNFASIKSGTLTQPTIGSFKNGIGEFYDQEEFDGKMILVKFIITPINKDTIRFEQSYSEDGGKTWEINWIATDTRIMD